jgi:hypothetical protein
MDWLGLINAVASVATAIGVLIAGQQIRLAKKLAITQFEDELTRQFREIIQKIPVDALLGYELDEQSYREARDDFFRYIDLSNEQIFLRKNGRVSDATWKLWNDGIQAFLKRPAFDRAWQEFTRESNDIFKELRILHKSNFQFDPKSQEGQRLLSGAGAKDES